MKVDKRKVVIVGTGMVGMSYAYSLLNQSVCDELPGICQRQHDHICR